MICAYVGKYEVAVSLYKKCEVCNVEMKKVKDITFFLG